MIETGSEYQLLQHFEAIPTSVATDKSSTDIQNATTTCINVDETTPKVIRTVDGSKFESFFDAIVNLLVIIPVK